ncbi:MAG: gluconokinase [Alphaproteobacteria bacterium]|nr:gluconokinase [Alphaproteobacteria bacterium]
MDQHSAHNRPMIVVVMGVSGCGKTTVGELLAARLGWQYQEGDALHPPGNVAKMSSGTSLDDADRLPWLHKIAERIESWLRSGESGVVTCSALKRSYRDIVVGGRSGVALVHLKGPHHLIGSRMAARTGHFMPTTLLANQYAVLEEPTPDERAIVIDVAASPADIVAEIVRRLGAAGARY